MRRISAIGDLLKHLFGFCFFFVMGFVIGLLPLGLLYSYITDDWDKDAPLYGGMMGAFGLSIAYVAICLRGRSVRSQEPDRNEQFIKHLLGWTFFTFLGFVLGIIIECALGSIEGYCLISGFCFSIGYSAYHYYGIPLRTAVTIRNDNPKQQN